MLYYIFGFSLRVVLFLMVTKLLFTAGSAAGAFESCVVSDGNQTCSPVLDYSPMFESCVVSDGNQTPWQSNSWYYCLRVVLFLMVTKQAHFV